MTIKIKRMKTVLRHVSPLRLLGCISILAVSACGGGGSGNIELPDVPGQSTLTDEEQRQYAAEFAAGWVSFRAVNELTSLAAASKFIVRNTDSVSCSATLEGQRGILSSQPSQSRADLSSCAIAFTGDADFDPIDLPSAGTFTGTYSFAARVRDVANDGSFAEIYSGTIDIARSAEQAMSSITPEIDSFVATGTGVKTRLDFTEKALPVFVTAAIGGNNETVRVIFGSSIYRLTFIADEGNPTFTTSCRFMTLGGSEQGGYQQSCKFRLAKDGGASYIVSASSRSENGGFPDSGALYMTASSTGLQTIFGLSANKMISISDSGFRQLGTISFDSPVVQSALASAMQ